MSNGHEDHLANVFHMGTPVPDKTLCVNAGVKPHTIHNEKSMEVPLQYRPHGLRIFILIFVKLTSHASTHMNRS